LLPVPAAAVAAAFDFLRRRKSKKPAIPTRARAATPPTTPPAIAPTLVPPSSFVSDSVADAAVWVTVVGESFVAEEASSVVDASL
jgi:hypothetical protein